MKNNLLSIMSEKNVSIVKLSKITGISRYTISALVNEKSTCNVHTLMQICDALNVTPNDILITKKKGLTCDNKSDQQ